MSELKGKLTELHIDGTECYGIIYLDDKTVQNRYFPFVTSIRTVTEKIRKGNGHYILHGSFVNDGGTTYQDSEVRFYTDEVFELHEENAELK